MSNKDYVVSRIETATGIRRSGIDVSHPSYTGEIEYGKEENRIKDYDFVVSGSNADFILPLDKTYSELFFVDNIADSLPMAKYLTPKIIKELKCKSVLDVGCATGHWLSCFEAYGVKIKGLEGTKAAFNHLLVDNKHIEYFDLREKYETKHTVDLVMSIEVAEHIEPAFVGNYIDVLTRHRAQNIIMTGAPPGQGGDGHVNLQPKEYWMEKLEDAGYRRDLKLEKKFQRWATQARGTQANNKEFLRLAVPGDNSGSQPGTPRQAHNWRNTYDSLYETPAKLHLAFWTNVWIPWWFPRNLMCFYKQD
jgi:SAM-dependent methyltransferase